MRREKDIVYIATISGGKDSVTMCDLLLKNSYPVDYIVFSDTLMEYPDMYIYLEKIKKYFSERYKRDIVITKPKSTFEDWCFGKIKGESLKLNGHIRGIPLKSSGICYWRRESKIYPFERWAKENKINNYKIYVGFTTDEGARINRETNKIYPLYDDFKMSERDCKQYLIEQEMENPLYKHFNRTGCFMCPFQSERSWKSVYDNYPKEWKYIKKIEEKLQELEDKGEKILNKRWFVQNKSAIDMENKFKNESSSLFDFSDEPIRDCFCKI